MKAIELIELILMIHQRWLGITPGRFEATQRREVADLLKDCKDCNKIGRGATVFAGIPSLRWAVEALVLGMKSRNESNALLSLHVEQLWLQSHYRFTEHPWLHRNALLFLSFRMWDRCNWLFPRLEPSHPSKRFQVPGEEWILRYPLELYCRCLWGRFQGTAPSAEDVEGCGVYGGIFTHWDDAEQMATTIQACCDYHLSRALEPEGYDVHEFDRAPFTLLPVEILALQRVRDKLGLPIPEVDHPLLNTPLMKSLPETLPEVQDELLDKLKEAMARCFPQDGPNSAAVDAGGATEAVPEPPSFDIEEQTEKTGFFRRTYHLNATMRFVHGETLETHWARLLEALEKWRKKRGRNASILTISFQSDPALHPDLYGEYARRVQSDPALEAWIETLSDYTLSFQQLDGTDCRDLVWEKQPDGSNLFSEMKFSTQA